MTTLTALMLATPLFGMSLQIDTAMLEAPAMAVDPGAFLATAGSTELNEPTTADLIRKRNKIKKVHKWFGITTWALTTLTVAAGFVQFHNQYGWWQSQATNPCVQGTAFPNQNQCSGVPTAHLTLSALSSVAFFTTFGLSFAMPDPLGVSEGDSKFARQLRAHKALRWVTFAGFIAQIALGVVSANSEWFGIDRANNYKTLRAISTAHLAVGVVTWGALTAQGALMVF
jgi:cytochrome b561